MLRSLQMVATPIGHFSLIGDLSEEAAGSFWWSSRRCLRCRWRDYTWKDNGRPRQTSRRFFGRCREKNAELNKEKLVLRSDNITFMGHTITTEGLQTDPQKIEATKDYPIPQSLEELRRFPGMVNYLARYLSHLTEAIHPLQNLLMKDVPWTWSDSQAIQNQQIASYRPIVLTSHAGKIMEKITLKRLLHYC